MATNSEAKPKGEATHQFWKGLGYIATGVVLIILALVFSGIALDNLSQQAGINPIAPTAVFFMTCITGTVWGAIFIWKGTELTAPRECTKSQEQYGTGYRLAKLIIVVLSKTIFRHHKFRWQRIRAS